MVINKFNGAYSASIWLPNDIYLANTIEYNILGRCQYNWKGMWIVNKIGRPSIAKLKGKSTEHQKKIKRSNIFTIKKLDAYSKVHMDIEIVFVNGCSYFKAISQHIGLINCCLITSRATKRVVNVMDSIITHYEKQGFMVDSTHSNNKFRSLDDWFTKKEITLVTCDTNTHIPGWMYKLVSEGAHLLCADGYTFQVSSKTILNLVYEKGDYISKFNSKKRRCVCCYVIKGKYNREETASTKV